MNVALIPFDPTVGDIQGNAERASHEARSASANGAEIVVFPELAVCGYPPRDLLLRAGFAEACERAVERIARAVPQCTVIIGSPRSVQGGPRPVANSVAVLERGHVAGWYDKRLLPSYDVFDEHRYFTPGAQPWVAETARGARVGVVVCEDLWQAQDVNARAAYGIDPLAETISNRPHLVVALSASPFERGKHGRHERMVADAARRAGCPVASVNQSGSYDDLVFDGDARMVWPDGRTVRSERWGTRPLLVRGSGDASVSERGIADDSTDLHDLWCALLCGTRGYLARTGHTKAIVGISGGIDSALVATIAAAALGPGNVLGILMPSRWSSAGSVSDAMDLAQRLGIGTMTLPIDDTHAQLARAIGDELACGGRPRVSGLTDENIQSRLRGLQVMAVSNATGALVLTTGNKSEYAVGYTTLYGDMNGGLAPIGDVLKTDVWALARWLNANASRAGFARPPIPEASIAKPPSAELRPDQTDQDTLPPYEHLDAIVRAWVEEERSEADVVRHTGLPGDLVHAWTTAIDRAEFKRYQAAVILKVSSRAFGRGRRMPLAQRWRPC